jgi:hypothetical protein
MNHTKQLMTVVQGWIHALLRLDVIRTSGRIRSKLGIRDSVHATECATVAGRYAEREDIFTRASSVAAYHSSDRARRGSRYGFGTAVAPN